MQGKTYSVEKICGTGDIGARPTKVGTLDKLPAGIYRVGTRAPYNYKTHDKRKYTK